MAESEKQRQFIRLLVTSYHLSVARFSASSHVYIVAIESHSFVTVLSMAIAILVILLPPLL